MYNGLGLPTPRGSGTSGYVQKNLSYVGHKTYHQQCYERDPTKAKSDALYKRRDISIIEHEKKREIEIKCLELSDMLEEQGYPEEEVTAKVNEFRKALFERQKEESLVENTAEEAKSTEEAKNKRMKDALGISDDYVEGSAFNFEEKKKIVEAEKAEREMKNQKRKEEIENLEKAVRKREKQRQKERERALKKEQEINRDGKKSSLRDHKDDNRPTRFHEIPKESENNRRRENEKSRVVSSAMNERKREDYDYKRSPVKETRTKDHKKDNYNDHYKRKRRDISNSPSPARDNRKRLVNDNHNEKYSERRRDISNSRSPVREDRKRFANDSRKEKYSERRRGISNSPSPVHEDRKRLINDSRKEKYSERRRDTSNSPSPVREDRKRMVNDSRKEKYSDRRRDISNSPSPSHDDRKRLVNDSRKEKYSDRRRESSKERHINKCLSKVREREISKDRRSDSPKKDDNSSKPQYTVRRNKVDISKSVSKKRRLFTSRSRSSSVSSSSPSPRRR